MPPAQFEHRSFRLGQTFWTHESSISHRNVRRRCAVATPVPYSEASLGRMIGKCASCCSSCNVLVSFMFTVKSGLEEKRSNSVLSTLIQLAQRPAMQWEARQEPGVQPRLFLMFRGSEASWSLPLDFRWMISYFYKNLYLNSWPSFKRKRSYNCCSSYNWSRGLHCVPSLEQTFEGIQNHRQQ